MLIRASGPLHEGLFLLTLGASARYLVNIPGEPAVLFDPGASIHCDALLQRLARYEVTPAKIGSVFLTHVDADRAGAVAELKSRNPKIQVFGSAAMQLALEKDWKSFEAQEREIAAAARGIEHSSSSRFRLDRVLVEGEVVTIAPGVSVRALASPGHSKSSLAYLLEPHRALIGDEGLGYFRGRELPAPGCDSSISDSLGAISSLLDIEIAVLCLPYMGALTGELIHRHLHGVKQICQDVVTESKKARLAAMGFDEIRAQIERGLYATELSDPLLRLSLQRSFGALWGQIEPQLREIGV